MSEEVSNFEIPKNIDRYLAALSKLYAQEGKRPLQELIVNATTRVHEEWSRDNWNGGGIDKAECPACAATGMRSGSLWNEEVSDDQDPDDPATEWVDLTYVTEEFLCPTCGLRLFGTKEIEAGGLSEEYTKSEAREREFGDEYGND